MKLELVPVPVSDIDRAKTFYSEKIGFVVDHDIQRSELTRIVQLTPPGSACSIVLGKGFAGIAMEPGSLRGLHLVVKDTSKSREMIAGRGVEVGEIVEFPGGIKYALFTDPDGNSWTLQEIPQQRSN